MSWGQGRNAAKAKRVLRRDAHTCYQCGNQAHEADHITPLAEGGADDETNMAAICRQCHRVKTQAEASRGKARRQALRYRTRLPHPGMKTPPPR